MYQLACNSQVAERFSVLVQMMMEDDELWEDTEECREIDPED